MPRARAIVFAALVTVVGAAPSPASAATHPHFDDRGTLVWYRTLPEAEAAARASGKLIFMESGRRECGSCRKLVERTIPQEPIRSRIAAIAVGLADDCDVQGSAAGVLLSRNLPGATFLPLVGFATPEGRWITGWFGGVTPAQVMTHLELAEKACAQVRAQRTGSDAAGAPAAPPAPCPTPAAPPAAPRHVAPAPVMPTPRATVPAPHATVPAPRTIVSVPRGTVPAPRTVVSVPRGTVPAPRTIVSVPRGTVPAPVPSPRVAVPGPRVIARSPAVSPPAPRSVPVVPPAAAPSVPVAPPARAQAPSLAQTPSLPQSQGPGSVRASGSATGNDPVTRARVAADSGDWGAVLRLWEETGNSRNATLLADLSPYAERAHLWCLRQVDDAEQAARDRRYDDAMRSLDLVQRSLEGTTCPIAVDAERGERAIERLMAIERGSPDQADAPEVLRRRAYQEFRGSRWAPLFRSRS